MEKKYIEKWNIKIENRKMSLEGGINLLLNQDCTGGSWMRAKVRKIL